MPTLYPPTGHFPARPQTLERDILDEAYSELRHAYRGLMVSRGLFRSKADQNRAAMLELEARLRATYIFRFMLSTDILPPFINVK